METRHATLGRRTLEEIRQKRAAERLSKASPVSDLQDSNQPGIPKSESGNRLSEKDIHGLVSQLKDLDKKNAELEEENKKLTSKLQVKEVENDTLLRRLNDLENNSLPSLRKSLRDAVMEKDAAVVAREDLSAQLRTMKKRLKEAEEEQYRAEEDAAALRSELNSIQQQAMMNPLDIVPSSSNSPDHLPAMEKELDKLRSELQQESLLRQQEQQRLAEEQAQISALISEKQNLEERLAALSKKASEEVLEEAARKVFSMNEKDKLEQQLHDMAVMVERLESSRQKLLIEIDSQSSEIERLFEENSNLTASYEDAMGVVVQWENQVKNCLKENEELRSVLDTLRMEQARLQPSNQEVQQGFLEASKDDHARMQGDAEENLSLKERLAKEQSRAEALSAEVLQLSAKQQQALQAYNSLIRLYKPILRNVENNLMKIKQDGSFTAPSLVRG
ncbi:hypothetical protein NE237_009065 [Protea cynaroides]|uniref:Uncharacterized protein n=1 Tax=Protea cynaroides TaxID=273540 RepID=A0A9Q0R0D0_9MAGN|nr:hypothetical protein NE237_009065 [Protea cynaroides]